MNVSSYRRQRGGAMGWILILIVIAVAVYLWRDSISQNVQKSLTAQPNQKTARACARQFANAVIDQDEAAARRVCKAGRETQALQALRHFKTIVDSGGMSAPDKDNFSVDVGTPGRGQPGSQAVAKIVIKGVNKDPGANLKVTVEMQSDEQWQVIDASVTPIDR